MQGGNTERVYGPCQYRDDPADRRDYTAAGVGPCWPRGAAGNYPRPWRARQRAGRVPTQDDTLLSFVSAIDAVFALDERAPTRLLAPESRGLAWTSSREESGSQTMPSLSNRELIDKGRIASESPPRITSLETRSCGLLVAGQDLRLALPKAYGPLLCSNEFANELRR